MHDQADRTITTTLNRPIRLSLIDPNDPEQVAVITTHQASFRLLVEAADLSRAVQDDAHSIYLSRQVLRQLRTAEKLLVCAEQIIFDHRTRHPEHTNQDWYRELTIRIGIVDELISTARNVVRSLRSS